MAKLILLRHGESQWNKKNLFTGWVDVLLSKKGIEESIRAGEKMADLNVDVIYTSTLVRAQTTAFLAMAQSHLEKTPCVMHDPSEFSSSWYQEGTEEKDLIPVYFASELNERMYGDLQGKNKEEIKAKFGLEQMQLWRRSFGIAPPEGESLESTAKRAISFFQRRLIPHLERGQDVFVCAHGNSLRALVMHIDKLSEEMVLKLEIATGELYIYEYQEGIFSKV